VTIDDDDDDDVIDDRKPASVSTSVSYSLNTSSSFISSRSFTPTSQRSQEELVVYQIDEDVNPNSSSSSSSTGIGAMGVASYPPVSLMDDDDDDIVVLNDVQHEISILEDDEEPTKLPYKEPTNVDNEISILSQTTKPPSPLKPKPPTHPTPIERILIVFPDICPTH